MNTKKIITILSIVLSFVLVVHVDASVWSLDGSSSFAGSINTPVPITDLQISGGNPTDVIPVRLRVTSGTLAMSTTTGLTFTGSPTGSTLHFSGTRTNLNNALATLTYTRGSIGSDTLEVSLVEFGEVFFEENGHLYKYVSFTSTWGQAQTAAQNQTLYGATGYLTTITSAQENEFVRARLLNAGWMGASDSGSEGDWRWVTGPEAGTSFWSGLSNGSAVGGRYANWATGEPNNAGDEDCGQFLAGGSGQWNDLPCTVFTLPGYVVEFGAPGNMPQVAAKNITLSITAAPTVVSFSPSDNATTVLPTASLFVTFNEPVTFGTGTIVIRRTDTDVIVDSISVPSSQVLGSGTAVVTILPSARLSDLTGYYIQIPGTVFQNAGSTFFPGFTSKTIWNFSTVDATAPVLSVVQQIPNIIYETNATFTFSTTESGSYTLSSCGGGNSIIAHDTTVTFSGLTVGQTYGCTLFSTDIAGNVSNTITIGPFTVTALGTVALWALPQVSSPLPATSQTSLPNQTTSSQQALGQNTSLDLRPQQQAPFLIDMRQGSRIADVRRLQLFLRDQGSDIYPEGRITGIFGPMTHRAVIRFQERYREDVLSPINSTSGTGIVGIHTRTKINRFLGYTQN